MTVFYMFMYIRRVHWKRVYYLLHNIVWHWLGSVHSEARSNLETYKRKRTVALRIIYSIDAFRNPRESLTTMNFQKFQNNTATHSVRNTRSTIWDLNMFCICTSCQNKQQKTKLYEWCFYLSCTLIQIVAYS